MREDTKKTAIVQSMCGHHISPIPWTFWPQAIAGRIVSFFGRLWNFSPNPPTCTIFIAYMSPEKFWVFNSEGALLSKIFNPIGDWLKIDDYSRSQFFKSSFA